MTYVPCFVSGVEYTHTDMHTHTHTHIHTHTHTHSHTNTHTFTHKHTHIQHFIIGWRREKIIFPKTILQILQPSRFLAVSKLLNQWFLSKEGVIMGFLSF